MIESGSNATVRVWMLRLLLVGALDTAGSAQITETQKLVGPGGDVAQAFGYDVDLRGTDIFVAAPVSLTVEMFTRDAGLWTSVETVTPTRASAGFGRSLSVSDQVLAVGATGTYRVHAFDEGPGYWREEAMLPNMDIGSELTGSVAIAGSQIVAAGDTGLTFYENNGLGWSFVDHEPGIFSGRVALTDDRAVVSEGAGTPGRTFVFERTSGGWVQVDVLGSGAQGPVAIDGDLLATGNPDLGCVYLYETLGLGWSLVGQLMPERAIDDFGRDIHFDGERVIVGAGGAAYVFDRVSPTDWAQTEELIASDGEPGFGSAVAIRGDLAVVGDWSNGPSNAGAAYVFWIGRNGGLLPRTPLPTPPPGGAGPP